MNEMIIKEISNDLGITEKQVNTVLELLSEGNTVPFIARYRKEATGALDEEMIRKIDEVYLYQVNLLKRKEDVIRLIDEKGLLTDELKNQILNCSKLVEVEDLYRPYKEKKKTKATEAIALGLEPLAKLLMSFPINGNIESLASKFIKEDLPLDKCIEGAKYIIAEWISDNASYRKYIRNYFYKNGIISSTKKKNTEDADKIYEMYYDYNEPVKWIKPHRILALNRGENEKVLNVSIDIDKTGIIDFLEKKIIKNDKSFATNYIKEAIEDSYKRLIAPSIEREIRSDLTEKGETAAIDNFGKNLEALFSKESPLWNIGIHSDIVDLYTDAIETAREQRSGFQQRLSGVVAHLMSLAWYYRRNEAFSEVADKMNQAKILIAEQFRTISPEDLSKQLCLGYSNFRRIFKEYTGLAPSQYIQQIRIHRTKEMLTNTSIPIKQVAYEMGYENEDYFFTAFRRVAGMTPMEYRELTQGGHSRKK